MQEKIELEEFDVDDLEFDKRNPRLVEFGISEDTDEDEILATLWEAMDAHELAVSMSINGYFSHEPVIITKEGGKNIVIEGNRRLTALKVLLNPSIAEEHGWSIPETTPEILESLRSIPGYVQSREDSWRHIGYKHVNGPVKWTSYAKAKYIAQVHREYGVELSDIASQLGDSHGTVQRLYRGLMVLEQAQEEGIYDPEKRECKRLYFSHLYTGLERKGIESYLRLKPKEEETNRPVPESNQKHLGEVLTWLYGDKSAGKEAVVRTQNPDLKLLDEVLQDGEATLALRNGADLREAHEISRPSSDVLEELLLYTKRALMKARGHVSTGYDGSEIILKLAGTNAQLAEDIYEEILKKHRGDSKPARITDLDD